MLDTRTTCTDPDRAVGPQRCCGPLGFLRLEVDQRDVGSAGDERLADTETDAPGTAGDEGDLSLE
jgi:hypothetical protein